MPKITSMTDLGKIQTPQEFQRFGSQAILEIQTILNGKIEFGVNISAQTIIKYFTLSNTDYSIQHSLNKTGVNYIVGNKTGTCDIFHGTKIDSTSQIWLQSTASGVTVTLILF